MCKSLKCKDFLFSFTGHFFHAFAIFSTRISQQINEFDYVFFYEKKGQKNLYLKGKKYSFLGPVLQLRNEYIRLFLEHAVMCLL